MVEPPNVQTIRSTRSAGLLAGARRDEKVADVDRAVALRPSEEEVLVTTPKPSHSFTLSLNWRSSSDPSPVARGNQDLCSANSPSRRVPSFQRRGSQDQDADHVEDSPIPFSPFGLIGFSDRAQWRMWTGACDFGLHILATVRGSEGVVDRVTGFRTDCAHGLPAVSQSAERCAERVRRSAGLRSGPAES